MISPPAAALARVEPRVFRRPDPGGCDPPRGSLRRFCYPGIGEGGGVGGKTWCAYHWANGSMILRINPDANSHHTRNPKIAIAASCTTQPCIGVRFLPRILATTSSAWSPIPLGLPPMLNRYRRAPPRREGRCAPALLRTPDAEADERIGRVPLHAGNLLQPRNGSPVVRFVLVTIDAPQRGHSALVSVGPVIGY